MIISKNIIQIPKKKPDPSMIPQEKDQSTPPRSKLIKKANSEIGQEKE